MYNDAIKAISNVFNVYEYCTVHFVECFISGHLAPVAFLTNFESANGDPTNSQRTDATEQKIRKLPYGVRNYIAVAFALISKLIAPILHTRETLCEQVIASIRVSRV